MVDTVLVMVMEIIIMIMICDRDDQSKFQNQAVRRYLIIIMSMTIFKSPGNKGQNVSGAGSP